MLRIILIDDEQLILQHLSKIISTCPISHVILGTATNTEDAFSLIKSTKPNLIITDIQMADKNGLELCEKLKHVMPHTKIIILSGYDSFSYAQKALSFNVVNYLLKPLNKQELFKSLSDIEVILQKEKEEHQEKFLLKKQFLECLPLMQDWFFKIIQDNKKRVEIITSTFNLFSIDIINDIYQVIYVDFEKTNTNELESEFSSIARISQTLTNFNNKKHRTLFFYDTHSITFILSASYEMYDSFEDSCFMFASQIQQYLEFNIDSNFSIGLSSIAKDISSLHKSKQDAQSAANHSFYVGYNHIVYISDINTTYANDFLFTLKDIHDDILISLKICNEEKTMELLHLYYKTILDSTIDHRLAINKFLELNYAVSNILIQEFDYVQTEAEKISHKIDSCLNIEQAQILVKDSICLSLKQINEKRTTKNKKIVEKVKTYIQNNYSDDASLDAIAKEIGLSMCYLSTLYKKIEKKSIKEYIIDVRIEKSKIYLNDIDQRIYEIALKVGYTDSRYFSQLFRKKTGLTPGQFREKILSSANSK